MATKKNYSIKLENGKTVTAATKANLVIELAKNGVAIVEAEKMVKVEFMTAKQKIASIKKTNTALIKNVANKLTLARRLNAILNAKDSEGKWEKAIEAYNKYFGYEEIGKREVRRRIKQLALEVTPLISIESL